MTGPDPRRDVENHNHDDDNTVHPDFDHDPDHTPRPAAMLLCGLSAAFGIIGASIGFATLLGVTATASGGYDTSAFGPAVATAASSFVLGLLLLVGAALLWRAHRAARVVTGVAVTLLAVSSLARMALDSITFISVVGSVLSLLALVGMGSLLVSDDVREHLRRGRPLRLR